MKIVKLLFWFLFCMYASKAQKIILLSDTVILKPNKAAMADTVLYSITGSTTAGKEYNVTITDNAEGSAIPGKDYNQNAEVNHKTWTFTNPEPYVIYLRETETCNTANKTIILHLKAIPPSKDTTYRATFTLTIHRKDVSAFTKKDISDCKALARQTGTNWRRNNKLERNFDTTNTPKTEFVSYADFKGFDPDQPNGLAQNQFLFKWPIEKHWLINHEKFKLQYLRSFLFPNFLFNRIDKTNDVLLYKSRYDSLDTDNDGILDSFPLKDRNINSFDVIKYANFILNGKLTLANIQLAKSRIMLEWDITMYRLRVDSSKISQTFDPVYAISDGPHLFFETGVPGFSDAFQLRSIIGYEILRIRSNSFSQVDGISSTVSDNTIAIKTPSYPIVTKSSKLWTVSTRLSRTISKDNKSLVFFRYNISWQKIKNNSLDTDSIKKSFNQFSQFQLGFSLDINVFGSK